MKKSVKLNNQRVSFSKEIKRRILIEIAKGISPEEVFLKYAFNSINEISQDKKYLSKLLYKWRNEIYENREYLNFLFYKINNDRLDEEIKSMGNDEEEDNIFDKLEENLRIDFLKYIN